MNLINLLPLNETKLRVLLEIYAAGEDYLRNIEKKTKINPSLLHRVLKNFEKAGAVGTERRGKENFYHLTAESKTFFVGLLEKYHADSVTAKEIKVVVALILQNQDLLANCKHIYLFGSFVLGAADKKSDIDMLFVSRARSKVVDWCREAAVVSGREITPLIYTPEEFRSELKKKEPLLTSIVRNIKQRIIIK